MTQWIFCSEEVVFKLLPLQAAFATHLHTAPAFYIVSDLITAVTDISFVLYARGYLLLNALHFHVDLWKSREMCSPALQLFNLQ